MDIVIWAGECIATMAGYLFVAWLTVMAVGITVAEVGRWLAHRRYP